MTAPGSAIPFLKQLGFKRDAAGVWSLACWQEHFYKRVLRQVKRAGCHGRGYNIAVEKQRQKLEMERISREKLDRARRNGAARRAEIKRQDERRIASEALARARAVMRLGLGHSGP